MSRRPDAPSGGVVLVSGLGVAAVVGFVVILAMGGRTQVAPGEKVKVVDDPGRSGMAVLAGRCLDQRVTSVAIRNADGLVIWRVLSRKGSIERRYVVGGSPPFGFATDVALLGEPVGVVRAEVTFTQDGLDTHDERSVDADQPLPVEGNELKSLPPPCATNRGLHGTTLLFAVAAGFVVFGYVTMLVRFARR